MRVSGHTVRRHLDILASTFVVRLLRPWTKKLRKRRVEAPKVWVADSGLLHGSPGLDTARDLESAPRSEPPGRA